MNAAPASPPAALRAFAPQHDSFVGIDSDGCVFDTMAIKQKQCIHGEIVRHWRLDAIEPLLRETAEFVNLHSRWRGQNRFVCLVRCMDFLRERPEARASGLPIPAFASLRRWIDSGAPLGNPALERAARESGDPELRAVLAWSVDVNASIARTVTRARPFAGAVTALHAIAARSDAICVSQTPAEALAREWEASGLRPCVSLLAGQELGSKADHIRLAALSRYPADRILIVGDAPGDLQAARETGALFFPIDPGREEDSWRAFSAEGYTRFLGGTYAGPYQDGLIETFETLLPENPPWNL